MPKLNDEKLSMMPNPPNTIKAVPVIFNPLPDEFFTTAVLSIEIRLIIKYNPTGQKKQRAKIITGHEYQKLTFPLLFIFSSSNYINIILITSTFRTCDFDGTHFDSVFYFNDFFGNAAIVIL